MRLSSQNPRDMKALIQRQEEELIHLREEVEFLKEGKKLVIWKHREAAAEIKRLRAALEWIVGTALTEPEAMVAKASAALEERT